MSMMKELILPSLHSAGNGLRVISHGSPTPPSTTNVITDTSTAFNGALQSAGIFNVLGTAWGTITRTLATDVGDIALTSTNGPYGTRTSSTFPLYQATDGNNSTLAVTANGVNGDLIWDFGPHQRVTVEDGYYLKGRSDFGDYLRNWSLQGSDDGVVWTNIDVRTADSTMTSNAWTPYTFNTLTTYECRYLRLKMTGNTASGSQFMPLYEIEIYGSISDTQPTAGSDIDVTYRTGTFGGVVGYLGTVAGAQAWINPESRGTLISTSSSKFSATYGPTQLVAQSGTPSLVTTPLSSWWKIDLGPHRSVRPERYRIGNRTDFQDQILRWTFDASVDNVTWTTLSDHSTSIIENHSSDLGGTFVLGCDIADDFYRYFRIVPLETVAGGEAGLHKFEVYGVLSEDLPALAPGATRFMPSGNITSLDGIIQHLGNVTATVSSSVVGNAANTIDGNTGTGWVSSNTAGSTLTLNFGAHSVLPYVVGIKGRADSNDRHPMNFVIEYSDDNSSWTVALTPDPNEVKIRWNNGALMPFFIETTSHSYWRLRSTGVNTDTDNYFSIGEVEFWGDLT